MALDIQYAPTPSGTPIACTAIGAGPALLVPPAGPWGSVEVEWAVPPWREWYERLGAHATVLRYDERGTGLTGGEPDFTVEAGVADAVAVLDRLAPGPVDVLATQASGPVALALAALHPGRVRRLVLFCTFERGEAYFGSPQAELFFDMMQRDFPLAIRAITHQRFGWDQGAVAEQVAGLMERHFPRQVIGPFMAARRAADASALLPHITAPTLVAHRRGLPYPTLADAQRMAAGIPGARLALFDGESIAPFVGDDAPMHAMAAFLGWPGGWAAGAGANGAAHGPLSPREREVLALVAQGDSNQQVADALVIGVGTVKSHVNAILTKLGAPSRTRAAAIAREQGLV
jgi:DNA-binding CsgD family transcriptional regulator